MAADGDTAGLARLLAARPGLLDAEGSNKLTPLHCAATGGHASAVKLLLDLGASPDGGVSCGPNTPLLPVVLDRNVEVARLLLDAGPLLNVPRQFPPLCAAAASGDLVLTRMLLEAGADVNTNAFDATTEDGQLMAFVAGRATLIHDLTTLDRFGIRLLGPPLHWAAYRGHRETAELLLEQGARRDARGRFGRTAEEWATEEGHHGVAELLRGEAEGP